MKIGAHVSVAGGLENGIANAQKIGAEAIQIFGASPRKWQAKMPSMDSIKKYKEALKESKIDPVFLHASYLVNLASPSAENRQKSVKSLTDHLKIASTIGAEGLIFPVGSAKDAPKEKAIKFIISGIKQVLKNVSGKSKLILENDAGGGAKVGSAHEIGQILKSVKSSRVKVCFDTAHAFESGIIDEYSSSKIKSLFNEWDKEVGIKNIVAFHLNDSKTTSGSKHDRHANIGEGLIGLSGFKNLAKEPRLKNIPWILEVPGFDNLGPDKKNIDILKKITNSPSR